MATFGNPTRAAAQFDFGNYYQWMETQKQNDARQEKNPDSPDFDWWYWCGMKTNESKQTFITQYNQVVRDMPEVFYDNDTTRLDELEQENIITPIFAECMKRTIQQVGVDIIQNNRGGTNNSGEYF